MFERSTQLALFALYQTTVLLGILLLPMALLARRVGLPLPLSVGGAVAAVGEVYEKHAE
jgi:hypothetical protein